MICFPLELIINECDRTKSGKNNGNKQAGSLWEPRKKHKAGHCNYLFTVKRFQLLDMARFQKAHAGDMVENEKNKTPFRWGIRAMSLGHSV